MFVLSDNILYFLNWSVNFYCHYTELVSDMVVTLDTNIWWDSYPSGANNEIQTQPLTKRTKLLLKLYHFYILISGGEM